MSETTYRVTAHTLYRAVRDEGILVQLETGQYFGLDAVAHRMWQLLVESGRREATLARLEAEFEISPGTLAIDFDRLLEEWIDEGLIERGPAGDDGSV